MGEIMTKAFLVALLTLGLASFTLANDCGNGKDKGKGTPSCQKNGGNPGGNGGSGGTGGTANGGSSTVNVTNDNLTSVLNSVKTNVHNTNVNANANENTNSNTVKSNSNASQSQTANGGSASSTSNSSASNGPQSNAQSTSFQDVRQTASAIAPETFPTVPCFKSYSGAGQAAGFGFSLGGGKIDKGCEAREDARLLAAIGSKVAACKVILALPEVAKSGVTLEECISGK
jgi:hypothetical protein